MVVRFDPKKLQSNTSLDIGVQNEKTMGISAISEVEMIVNEARRNSGIDTNLPERNSEELRDLVIEEHEEEDQEPGPELTPEGQELANKILQERREKEANSTPVSSA